MVTGVWARMQVRHRDGARTTSVIFNAGVGADDATAHHHHEFSTYCTKIERCADNFSSHKYLQSRSMSLQCRMVQATVLYSRLLSTAHRVASPWCA